MRVLILSLSALLVTSCVTPTTPAASNDVRFVHVNGGRVAYRTTAGPGPTIVFEAPFGGEMSVWDTIVPQVAPLAATFRYDRPGRGQSDPTSDDADGMRTSEEVVRTLHATLQAAHVRAPYILAASSLGGLYIQKYAQLYPREVAGLVLIDNRPATYELECRPSGNPYCQPNEAPNPAWSAATQATFRGIDASEAVGPRPEDLGDIPVTVITAMATQLPEPGGADFARGFRDAQTRFAARLHHGRQVLAEGATHDNLDTENAHWVVDEIRRMVEEVRHGAHR